jgi:hypothetical protein
MTTTDTAGSVGKRYAVARYDNGKRVIVSQRIKDRTQLTDVSLTGGRSYVIEPNVGSRAELEPLVTDYLAKAAELGHCPMIPGGWWRD